MKTLNGFSQSELFELAIRKPMMAQLELTKNCNQACFFCFRYCNPSIKFKDLSLNDWKKIIDKLIDLGVEELNLSGGEIFLFKYLDSLLSYAKRKGIKRIIVNTNGSVSLQGHDLTNIDQLVFSVHDLGKRHEKIIGLPGAFSILKKNINYALFKKKEVGINTVVSKENIDYLPEIYEFFKNKKLIFHAFNLFIDRKHIAENNDWYQKNIAAYLRFLKKIPEERRKLRHGLQNIFYDEKSFFDAAMPLPHCAAGKYKLIIDYRGDVYPCRYFQEPEYFCGNILKDDANKIWRQGKGFEFFRSFVRSGHYPTGCKNCFKKYKCRGGCLAFRKIIKNKYEKDIRCRIGAAHS